MINAEDSQGQHWLLPPRLGLKVKLDSSYEVPFPSSDSFKTLPVREEQLISSLDRCAQEILAGMLSSGAQGPFFVG